MDQNEEKIAKESGAFIFRGQRSDEEVILAVRQHPWVLIKKSFWIFAAIIVIVISLALFGASAITSWIIFAMLMFILFYGLYNWFLWWNGNMILTNQRIIQCIQTGLFSRKILEAELGRIQDAVCEIKGLTDSMLNIGSIQLQTASNEKILTIEGIFNPYDIQQKIMNAQKHIHKPEELKSE